MNNAGDMRSQYKSRSQRKGIAFDLTEDQFARIAAQNCFYCDAVPTRVYSQRNSRTYKITRVRRNGIDRVDNFLGYTIDNCVPCCAACNRMKLDVSLEDFFMRVSRIYRLHINPGDNQ
jgi:hypothetical protein